MTPERQERAEAAAARVTGCGSGCLGILAAALMLVWIVVGVVWLRQQV